jgi:hypothetical protein
MRAAKHTIVLAACSVIVWAGSQAASAQEDPSLTAPVTSAPATGNAEQQGNAAGAFGTGTQDFWVGATQFVPRTAGTSWNHESFYYWSLDGTHAEALVDLPAGAYVSAIECFVYDADASDISIVFLERRYNCVTDVPSDSVPIAIMSSSGTSGYQRISELEMDRTLRYRNGDYANIYTLLVMTPTPSSNLRFRGCRFSWHRQVSVPPATATFPNDVPTSHPLFRYVEALAAAGVTSGCGTGWYCPNSPVTRGQMAVFLAVSLGMHWPY